MPKQRKLVNGLAKGMPLVLLAADGSELPTEVLKVGPAGILVKGRAGMLRFENERKTWKRP